MCTVFACTENGKFKIGVEFALSEKKMLISGIFVLFNKHQWKVAADHKPQAISELKSTHEAHTYDLI